MARTPYWDQIATGMTVYDRNGEKLGKVRDIDPEGQYLLVEKGWLFVKDFYVPADTVSSMDQDGIQLNLLKDQLNDARYDAPPVATAGSTALGGVDVDDQNVTTGTGAGKFDTAKNRMIDDAGQMRDDAASTTDRTTDRWVDR